MSVRILVAIAVLVSAYVHLKLWLDTMRHVHIVGPAFLLNVVAGVVIAVLLVAWRHWLAPLLAAGFGASTLGALTIASTVDLFGYHERWQGPYVWTSAVVEAIAIVAGLYAVSRELRTTHSRARQHSTVAG
jgi:energy-converting hydrogenase Eha subunit B